MSLGGGRWPGFVWRLTAPALALRPFIVILRYFKVWKAVSRWRLLIEPKEHIEAMATKKVERKYVQDTSRL